MKKRAPAFAPCGVPRIAPVVLGEDFSTLVRLRRLRQPGKHRKVALLH